MKKKLAHPAAGRLLALTTAIAGVQSGAVESEAVREIMYGGERIKRRLRPPTMVEDKKKVA